MNDKDSIRNICFSADGKKILFDRKKNDNPFMINIFDLETGDLSAYRSPNGENWFMARYSFDGKRIVLITMPYSGQQWDLTNAQIAIMDTNGKNVKKITNTTGLKANPSFSHSGKKIIYVKAGKIRKSGRTPAADYDVYELDMQSSKETRLTRFKFFLMSSPFYFPDDKKFIFSAESPFSLPGISDKDYAASSKMRDAIKSKYEENTIFVMRGGEMALKPYIEFYHYSNNPLLSADGSRMFFRGMGEPQTGGGWYQFYLYSPDGKHRRLTDIKTTVIWSAAVSPDGEQLAIVYDVAPEREINKIMICRVTDGTCKELSLPDQPSRIIN